MHEQQEKRMVGDTAYEIKHAMQIGDKEIIFAEDKKAENGMCYLVGNYTDNGLLGEYADCIISDDYLEAVGEFGTRVNAQAEATRAEIIKMGLPNELFTAEQCYPSNLAESIDGKIVAIKADIFRPEYRRGDVQLVLIVGGSGARANPSSRTIYGRHLNDGAQCRFYRADVQGEVKPEHLPLWAKERMATILADQAVSRQKKAKELER